MARIVQEPADMPVTVQPETVEPETEQGALCEPRLELSANVTDTPLVELPERDLLAPTAIPAGCAKVIVWLAWLIVKFWLTAIAARSFTPPAWLAVKEQVPTVTIVSIVPEAAQTLVVLEVRLRASPDVAVPLGAKAAGL